MPSKEEKKKAKARKMMLKGIVDIGEIAYNEEKERKKMLIEQSNGLVVVITLLVTFLGLLLGIIVENVKNVDLTFIYIMFGINTLVLLASLVCVLIVQWRMKYKKFINALDFFEEVKARYQDYKDESAFLNKKMSGLGDICKTESNNNDKRAKLIMASHILIFVSVFILIQTALIFALCII